MAADGWIKLHRCLQDNPLWDSEPFSRGQAWVDLLLVANHNPGYVIKRGIKVDLNRGDIGHSEDKLAKRWSWSRGKVRRFLALLIEQEMVQKIAAGKTSVSTCIRIVNYEKFQGVDKETVQKTDQKADQKTVQEQEEKEEKETTSGYSEKFETFWKEYPNKTAKSKAFTSWKKYKCDNGIFASIMDSLKAQKKSDQWLKDNGKFIPMGSTWVNGKRWEDELEPSTTTQPGGRQWI